MFHVSLTYDNDYHQDKIVTEYNVELHVRSRYCYTVYDSVTSFHIVHRNQYRCQHSCYTHSYAKEFQDDTVVVLAHTSHT